MNVCIFKEYGGDTPRFYDLKIEDFEENTNN
jgi:hypothetical protein